MKKQAQEQVWDKIAKKWRTFREKTPLEVEEFLKRKRGKVLDLGCGSGRNFIKNKNIIFYGVDFSEKMLSFAEKMQKEKKSKQNFSNQKQIVFHSKRIFSILQFLFQPCTVLIQKRREEGH